MRVIYFIGALVLLLFAGTAHAQVDLSGAWGRRFHEDALERDPADWLIWRRTLNSWGYSPLNQINKLATSATCLCLRFPTNQWMVASLQGKSAVGGTPDEGQVSRTEF